VESDQCWDKTVVAYNTQQAEITVVCITAEEKEDGEVEVDGAAITTEEKEDGVEEKEDGVEEDGEGEEDGVMEVEVDSPQVSSLVVPSVVPSVFLSQLPLDMGVMVTPPRTVTLRHTVTPPRTVTPHLLPRTSILHLLLRINNRMWNQHTLRCSTWSTSQAVVSARSTCHR
jgi:hypothetical protein